MNQEALRKVPQLEKLLHALGEIPGVPRLVVTNLVREHLEQLRQAAHAGMVPADFPQIVEEMKSALGSLAQSRLQPVINGTGVLIHTNLGRSPLGAAAGEALQEMASNYSNLELDLESGDRGKRGRFVEKCLAVACGAEAATVVNNCAAALVLILRTLVYKDQREVIISRGQLVEIGGGFRVPEIMETSGALLREVGATNKTSLEDYRKAISHYTAMLLRVHRSNFYMEGFVSEPDTAQLAALAAEHDLPLVEDLGSGAFVATDTFPGLEHEPTPAEVIAQGADIVCFSGDKLFGGPQAGIIVGKANYIAALKKDPFFRALRCDKLILAAIQETVSAYLHHMTAGRTPEQADLPLLEMLRTPIADLEARAQEMIAQLQEVSPALAGDFTMGTSTARPGGGTMPRSELASRTLRIQPQSQSVESLAQRLRTGSPPIVGYVEANGFCLDLRTIFPRQDAAVVAALSLALAPHL